MSDMVQLCESRLIFLGIDSYRHSTWLAQDIEDYIVDIIIIQNLSRTYSLAFDDFIRHVLEIISTNQDKISSSSSSLLAYIYIIKIQMMIDIAYKHNLNLNLNLKTVYLTPSITSSIVLK